VGVAEEGSALPQAGTERCPRSGAKLSPALSSVREGRRERERERREGEREREEM
jgi:hypothetical protein